MIAQLFRARQLLWTHRSARPVTNTVYCDAAGFHGVENAVYTVHHLMQPDADSFGFRCQSVPQWKLLERLDIEQNRVAPTPSGFGRV
jgi:hypothetical protein